MLLNNYQSDIISIIQKYVNDGWILSFNFSVDTRSNYVGFIQGNLEFLQGSRLFFKEYVNLQESDVSFVRAARLRQSPRYFGELVPDLVVEIKSQSDRIKPLVTKIINFITLGAVIGILIDPDEETVTVYRHQGEPTILNNGDILTLPELFPGWELAIPELWPPIFTEEETQG